MQEFTETVDKLLTYCHDGEARVLHIVIAKFKIEDDLFCVDFSDDETREIYGRMCQRSDAKDEQQQQQHTQFKRYLYQDMRMDNRDNEDVTVTRDTCWGVHVWEDMKSVAVVYKKNRLPVCGFPCTIDMADVRHVRRSTVGLHPRVAVCFESSRSETTETNTNMIYLRVTPPKDGGGGGGGNSKRWVSLAYETMRTLCSMRDEVVVVESAAVTAT